MRILLDTHTFLWWLEDNPQLSQTARDAISNWDNEILISTATIWEISIKYGYGKLALAEPPDTFLPDMISQEGFTVLPVKLEHATHVYKLPLHHRDPFDRLLIAQSQIENCPLISADRQFSAYGISILW